MASAAAAAVKEALEDEEEPEGEAALVEAAVVVLAEGAVAASVEVEEDAVASATILGTGRGEAASEGPTTPPREAGEGNMGNNRSSSVGAAGTAEAEVELI